MTLPSGSAWIDITLEQVDKKSPVDDTLMTSAAEDLYYLKNNVGAGGVFEFKVNGRLGALRDRLPFRRIDGAFVMQDLTLVRHSMFLELAGTTGTTEVDMRKYRTPRTPIVEIAHQYADSISSITRAGASSNTQSITKATPQVNTQSIAYFKTQISLASIIGLGGGYFRYNLATALDADWEIADSVLFASCTNAANDGTLTIKRKNDDGLNNIIVFNPAGVDETTSPGNVNLLAFKYTLINPATAEFVVGENALLAAHTSALNDGKFAIYALNSGGNNIVVKNPVGVLQAGVAGTVDSYRWKYTLGAAAPSDLVVGETALFAAHTSAVNDGTLRLTAVNDGGNNVIAYNETGAAQGGVAGTVDSLRWIYALASDPTASFSVGQTFISLLTTSLKNRGSFAVKQINRSATNNLVIHNADGVTQGGAVGSIVHTRKLIKFAADQSAIYAITKSRIEMTGTVDASYALATAAFDVLEVNRGGGANFNVVIDNPDGLSQASPAGHVDIESRSIFSTRPTITSTDNLSVSSNGVLDSTEKTIAAGRFLSLEILSLQNGNPQNLTVHAS